MTAKDGKKPLTAEARPADGERRALAGYVPQYVMAATVILDALIAENLVEFRVADPEAGRVDDVLIVRTDRVDAHQVKWTTLGAGTVTFRDFTKPFGGHPALVRQLADGWKAVVAKYAPQNCCVHLSTCQQPSTSDNAMGGARPDTVTQGDASFAAFRHKVWDPVRKHRSADVVPPIWKPAWVKMCAAAGLAEAEAVAFVVSCRLDFNLQVPKLSPEWEVEDDGKYSPSQLADLSDLYVLLMEIAGGGSGVVSLDRVEILQRLRWEGRYASRHRHTFPQPQFRVSNRTTEAELDAWLMSHDCGYLALIGSPGSGKSTLGSDVFQTSSRRNLRVVRYLAHVHGKPLNDGRGEAKNFLHDLSTSLRAMGYRPSEAPAESVDGLRSQVLGQLQQCGAAFADGGPRVLLHIDGLDHVPREHQPSRSFLKDLPLPTSLPAGVLVAVGTQRLDLTDVPHEVQQALRDEQRQVKMSPLAPADVVELLKHSGCSKHLNQRQLEQAARATEGHPLSVTYLAAQLSEAMPDDEVDRILGAASVYGGEVERRYKALWAKEVDPDGGGMGSAALGLACRLRHGFQLGWMAKATGNLDLVKPLQTSLRHLFEVEPDGTYHFFHNSFRQFVRLQTAESGFTTAVDAEQRHHAVLAEACRASGSGQRQRWELAYHAHHAGEPSAVVAEVTRENLAAQLAAFRPVEDILGDCRLLFSAAIALGDPVILLRSMLLCREFRSRQDVLDDEADWLNHLAAAGAPAAVMWHASDNRSLRVSGGRALRLARALVEADLQDQALRLFNAASQEALVLADTQARSVGHERIPFEDWSAAAARLLLPDDALQRMEGISNACHTGTDQNHECEEAKDQMSLWLVVSLARAGRWSDTVKAVELLTSTLENNEEWLRVLLLSWSAAASAADGGGAGANVGGAAEAATALSEIIKQLLPNTSPTREDAPLVYRLLMRGGGSQEVAREVLSGVEDESVETLTESFGDGERGLMVQEINLASVWAEATSPAITPPLLDREPSLTQPHLCGIPLFLTACRDLGAFDGLGRGGAFLTREEVERRLVPLVRLFNRSFTPIRGNDLLELHGALKLRGAFFSRLVQAAAKHGVATLEQTRQRFIAEWADPKARHYWPCDSRREVLMAFVRLGQDPFWVIAELQQMAERSAGESDARSRVEFWGAHAGAYAEVFKLEGLPEAEEGLKHAVRQARQVSLGIGSHKDGQLTEWIGWLGDVNAAEPAGGAERIRRVAALVCSEEVTSDGGGWRSAEALLGVAWRCDPQLALSLLLYLHEAGVGTASSLVRQFLIHAAADAPGSLLIEEVVVDLFASMSAETADDLFDAAVRNSPENLTRGLEVVSALSHPDARDGWIKLFESKLGIAGETAGTEDEEEAGQVHGIQPERPALETALSVLDPATADRGWTEHADDAERSIAGALAIAIALPEEAASATTLAAVSRRLLLLGDRPSAFRVAKRAVECSKLPCEYERVSAGRVVAESAWAEAAGNKDLSRVWMAFEEIGTAGFSSPEWTVEDFRGDLRLLCSDIPWVELWVELDAYLQLLFEESDLPEALPIVEAPAGSSPKKQAAEAVVRDWLVAWLTHPVRAILESTRRVLGLALVRGDHGVGEALAKGLGSDDEHTLAVLQILDAAVRRAPDCLEPFIDSLVYLSTSPNLQIRHLARGLLGLDIAASAADSRHFVPAHPDRDLFGPAFAGVLLPGRIDSVVAAEEELKAFQVELHFLADAAGIQYEALLPAVADLLKRHTSGLVWTEEAEALLQSRLSNHGPTLTWIRPRARAARLVIGRAAASLADAGRLSPDAERVLDSGFFRHHDPSLLMDRPCSRPSELELGEPPLADDLDAWAAAAALETPSFLKYLDGNWVVAEVRRVESLAGGGGREWIHQGVWTMDVSSACAIPGPRADVENGSWVHEKLLGWPSHDPIESVDIDRGASLDLPAWVKRRRPALAAALNSGSWRDGRGEGILVPAEGIAERFSWNREPGSFSWRDEGGRLMLRTLSWQQGQCGTGYIRRASQAAEGSLLLATEDGESCIRAVHPALSRVGQVERIARRSDIRSSAAHVEAT